MSLWSICNFTIHFRSAHQGRSLQGGVLARVACEAGAERWRRQRPCDSESYSVRRYYGFLQFFINQQPVKTPSPVRNGKEHGDVPRRTVSPRATRQHTNGTAPPATRSQPGAAPMGKKRRAVATQETITFKFPPLPFIRALSTDAEDENVDPDEDSGSSSTSLISTGTAAPSVYGLPLQRTSRRR